LEHPIQPSTGYVSFPEKRAFIYANNHSKYNQGVFMLIEDSVKEMEYEIIEAMIKLIKIKAVNPASGGSGELYRAEFIDEILKNIGFKTIDRFDVMDDKNVVRPNIVAKYGGKNQSRTIWFVAHMDTVPEGDLALWETEPFEAVYKEGKIYGRGTVDNGQGLLSIIYAIKALKKSGFVPAYNIGLLIVSDEEMGSRYGLEYIKDKINFNKNDIFYVPDSGVWDGTEIEIAEKSILWFRITIKGMQSHGSRPDLGINANRICIELSHELIDTLYMKYSSKNLLFTPPTSTFEPTKRESNVYNVNTIPGIDISYFDCRILPEYNVNEVISVIREMLKKYEDLYHVDIKMDLLQRNDATEPTSEESEAVQKLMKVLKRTRNLSPKVVGIGGGTCAAIIRRMGYQAVVWSTIDAVEHSPNEYCKVANLINDTITFAYIMLWDKTMPDIDR
jgi:succinyl-diaminopimelate desuccinylase